MPGTIHISSLTESRNFNCLKYSPRKFNENVIHKHDLSNCKWDTSRKHARGERERNSRVSCILASIWPKKSNKGLHYAHNKSG